MKQWFRIRHLRTRIYLVFGAITLFSVSGTSAVLIYLTRNILAESLAMQSGHITENLSRRIISDIGGLEEMISDAGSVQDPESGRILFKEERFQQAAQYLGKVREKIGLKYLYILSTDSEGIYYVIDGSEQGTPEYAYPGSRSNTGYEGMRQAFSLKRTVSEPITYTEKEGALISAYSPVFSKDGALIAVIGADFDAAPAYNGIRKLYLTSVIITAFSLIVTLLITYFFSANAFRTLEILSEKIQAAGAGDLTVSVSAATDDETGRIAASFTEMMHNLSEIIQSVQSMGTSVENLTTQIAAGAESMSRAARDIRQQIEEVTYFAKDTVVDSKVTLLSVDELSSALSQIQQSAGEISGQSASSADQARTGNAAIQKAIRQMNTISQSVERSVQMIDELDKRSAEIGEIIKTITGIAGQTNMLALNASIEAARAGDQGRGFAIVADQVNKLADQSSMSARQIAALISEIQKETKNSVASMDDVTKEVIEGINVIYSAGRTFETIVNSAENLNERICALNEISLKMTKNMDEVSRSIHSMTEAARHSMMMFEYVAGKTREQEESASGLNSAAVSARESATVLRSSLWRFTVSDSGPPSDAR